MLIGSSTLLIYPVSREFSRRQSLITAAQAVEASLSAARLQAISSNLSVRLSIHPDGRQFSLAAGKGEPAFWNTLPSGVAFVQIPVREIAFHSRGNASPAGSVTLQNEAGHIRVIASVSGRIRRSGPSFDGA